MKLTELNNISACNILKSLLANEMEQIKTSVFVNTPESALPINFITISPNGGMDDLGNVGEGVLLLNVCVKLLQKNEVNNVKLTRILEVIEKVIPYEGVRKDNYYFTFSEKYKYSDGIDYSLGYAVKSLNVYFRVQRTNN